MKTINKVAFLCLFSCCTMVVQVSAMPLKKSVFSRIEKLSKAPTKYFIENHLKLVEAPKPIIADESSDDFLFLPITKEKVGQQTFQRMQRARQQKALAENDQQLLWTELLALLKKERQLSTAEVSYLVRSLPRVNNFLLNTDQLQKITINSFYRNLPVTDRCSLYLATGKFLLASHQPQLIWQKLTRQEAVERFCREETVLLRSLYDYLKGAYHRGLKRMTKLDNNELAEKKLLSLASCLRGYLELSVGRLNRAAKQLAKIKKESIYFPAAVYGLGLAKTAVRIDDQQNYFALDMLLIDQADNLDRTFFIWILAREMATKGRFKEAEKIFSALQKMLSERLLQGEKLLLAMANDQRRLLRVLAKEGKGPTEIEQQLSSYWFQRLTEDRRVQAAISLEKEKIFLKKEISSLQGRLSLLKRHRLRPSSLYALNVRRSLLALAEKFIFLDPEMEVSLNRQAATLFQLQNELQQLNDLMVSGWQLIRQNRKQLALDGKVKFSLLSENSNQLWQRGLILSGKRKNLQRRLQNFNQYYWAKLLSDSYRNGHGLDSQASRYLATVINGWQKLDRLSGYRWKKARRRIAFIERRLKEMRLRLAALVRSSNSNLSFYLDRQLARLIGEEKELLMAVRADRLSSVLTASLAEDVVLIKDKKISEKIPVSREAPRWNRLLSKLASEKGPTFKEQKVLQKLLLSESYLRNIKNVDSGVGYFQQMDEEDVKQAKRQSFLRKASKALRSLRNAGNKILVADLTLFLAGDLSLQAGEFKWAGYFFETFLCYYSNSALAYRASFLLAEILYRQGQRDKAKEFFLKTLGYGFSKYYGRSLYRLAKIYQQQNLSEKAISYHLIYLNFLSRYKSATKDALSNKLKAASLNSLTELIAERGGVKRFANIKKNLAASLSPEVLAVNLEGDDYQKRTNKDYSLLPKIPLSRSLWLQIKVLARTKKAMPPIPFPGIFLN